MKVCTGQVVWFLSSRCSLGCPAWIYKPTGLGSPKGPSGQDHWGRGSLVPLAVYRMEESWAEGIHGAEVRSLGPVDREGSLFLPVFQRDCKCRQCIRETRPV